MEIPLTVAELDHVVLRCRDQDRMLDFYTRVLGLNEERRIAQIGLIQLRAGASMIDLVPAAEPRIESGTNVDHFCLGIETGDLHATINYLRANSVEILGEPAMRYGARGMGNSLYVHDPEGNVIELKQMPRQEEKREKE
ncbi:MAG: VOC family protein [Deltaproteobacteria bacterium]|nr:VOC family protein [Deltaproteobacteria bacterium]